MSRWGLEFFSLLRKRSFSTESPNTGRLMVAQRMPLQPRITHSAFSSQVIPVLRKRPSFVESHRVDPRHVLGYRRCDLDANNQIATAHAVVGTLSLFDEQWIPGEAGMAIGRKKFSDGPALHMGSGAFVFLVAAMGNGCINARQQGLQRKTYSHSIVAGGLLEMSYTTRDTPGTSLMIRRDTRSRNS